MRALLQYKYTVKMLAALSISHRIPSASSKQKVSSLLHYEIRLDPSCLRPCCRCSGRPCTSGTPHYDHELWVQLPAIPDWQLLLPSIPDR